MVPLQHSMMFLSLYAESVAFWVIHSQGRMEIFSCKWVYTPMSCSLKFKNSLVKKSVVPVAIIIYALQ